MDHMVTEDMAMVADTDTAEEWVVVAAAWVWPEE